MVLYLARRCEPTVARARRHYVIAYGPRQRPGASEFRATLSRRVVTPRQGRACLLLAGRDGRRLRQDSARYAV